MAEGKADELRKLAALRDEGIITEKEFGEQKRRLLHSDPGATWLMRSQAKWSLIPVGLIIVLIAGLLVFTRPGSGSSTPVVRLQETAASEGQIATAVDWAMAHEKNHNLDQYNQECLEFVYYAWKAAGVDIGGFFAKDTPAIYWNQNRMGWVEHPSASPQAYNNPPEGALVFWDARSGYPDGHVAISLGDVNGSYMVVSTNAAPEASSDPNVFTFDLSKRNPVTYKYLGYIMPLETPPTATPTPIQVQPAGGGSQLQPAGGGSSLQPASGSTTGNLTTPTPQKASTPTPSTPTPSTPTPSTPTPSTPTPSTPHANPPAPPTYAETVGGVTHTWTNYSNAGGSPGATITTGTTVQITCRVTGFKVADGNTWWYEIASSPWNNAYFASADAFYNNGDTSGSLSGTPWLDANVPVC